MGKGLLVIDMQTGIFNLKQSVFNQEQLIENINALILFARKQKNPIFFTQQNNKTFLIKGSEAWEIIPELNRHEKDGYVYKSHPGIFKNTNLESLLNEMGINHLLICGLITNGCVQQACADSFEKGYHVTLVSDAHSTFYKNPEKIISHWNNQLSTMGIRLSDTKTLVT